MTRRTSTSAALAALALLAPAVDAQVGASDIGLKLETTSIQRAVQTGSLRVAVLPRTNVRELNLIVGIREHGSWTRISKRGSTFAGDARKTVRIRLTQKGVERLAERERARLRIAARRDGRRVAVARATLVRM